MKQHQAPYRTSTTVKPFTIEDPKRGAFVTLLPGWPVSNNTASGPDNQYRFAMRTGELARLITGFAASMLHHDWFYYGLSIPAEFCNPYQA